jgi:hypothetical protein
MSLALTAATGGALLMYYNHLMEQKLNKSERPGLLHAGFHSLLWVAWASNL